MAISIVVEDGSIVENANSYIGITYARQYCLQRGIELPVDDDAVVPMIIAATDFLESKACKYAGTKTNDKLALIPSISQELEWPRKDAFLFGDEDIAFDSHTIPSELKRAQAALVIAVSQGIVLLPNIGPLDYITEETVGPITTKYANPIQSGIEMTFTGVDYLLNPLYSECNICGGFKISTVRV